ncbi:copper resistance protein NlpE [Bacteroides sp.]
MKKKIYFVAIALGMMAMISCTGSAKKSSTSTTDSTQVADMHTAETSLDYYGEYKGTIPAADCPGIEMTLILNKDNTFTLHSSYIDRNTEFDESGTFSVNGNILTLTEKSGEKSYYKVEEGRVVMLNADKQAVEGALADAYILKQEKVY